ncbi:Carboxypeptidase A4 [Dinochytrium kinnereticum]|nr:Carboxypeptidase A4 [Dinochytrium kinnereticum]
MVSFVKLAALVVAAASAVSAFATENYRNNKVYRFEVKSVEQAAHVQSVLNKYSHLAIDNWSHGVKGNVDIMIPDAAVATLKNELFDIIPSTVFIEDVKARLDEEKAFMSKNSFKLQGMLAANPETVITAEQVFSDYQDLATIVAFMKNLPGATQFSVGKSWLKADIPGFKIGTGPKSIIFHGGIHAREWISVAVSTYLANFLATDPTAAKLREQFTFHIVPVLNVDGYAYTRSTNRLWRKNLQRNPGSICLGTDPNRNWDFGWSLPGASGNPCDEVYYGSGPFSTPEARAMANYILSVGNAVSYMDFHAYSQLWLFPNGYTCDTLIKDYASVKAGGEKAVEALAAVHGNYFVNGDVCNTIYQASGSSIDWAYNVANVTYTYTAELRDTGKYGFELPANQIIPAGEEIQAAMVALWEYVAEQVYNTGTPTSTSTSEPTTVIVPTATTTVVVVPTATSTTTIAVPTTSSTITEAPVSTSTTTTVVAPTTTATPVPTPVGCVHSKCQIGSALGASCDACVGQIVAADAYCGTVAWDPSCVAKVKSVCGLNC